MSSELVISVIDIEWKINFRKNFHQNCARKGDEAARETDDDDVSDKLVCEKKMIENFTRHWSFQKKAEKFLLSISQQSFSSINPSP